MATVTAPIGFEGMGDWSQVASKARRFDEISPAFEEVAVGREARAREAEREGNEVTARESYLVASIYYGVAQWPIDEINDRNRALNAKKAIRVMPRARITRSNALKSRWARTSCQLGCRAAPDLNGRRLIT
jgi:hypothetical protein